MLYFWDSITKFSPLLELAVNTTNNSTNKTLTANLIQTFHSQKTMSKGTYLT